MGEQGFQMIARLLLPALLLSLAGCASSPAHDGPDRPGGPPRVRLFISPSGEPFRGEDGFGRWLAQADTDHDGGVTLAEFRADAQHSFKFLDTSGDGVIDGFEMQHYEREVVPEIGTLTFEDGPSGRRRRFGGRGGGSGDQQAARAPAAGREGAARYSLLNEAEPVAVADANLDGKVTLAEWLAITDRRFIRLDHDKSGRLTRASLLHLEPKPQKGR